MSGGLYPRTNIRRLISGGLIYLSIDSLRQPLTKSL